MLPNAIARRLFLHRHALGHPPSGPGRGDDLLGLITALGFVQVDSVCTVERAHHMILHARRTAYRPPALTRLLERDRALFEHWTHDAAILPMAFHPHWQLRCARDELRLRERWNVDRREGYLARCRPILDHIARHGACRSDAFADERPEDAKGDGWWDWHPSKTALEYLWRSGRLTVAARQGFRKLYDLPERVIPQAILKTDVDAQATLDWCCAAALDRLGFATPGEIASFWALATPAEARDWCDREVAAGQLETIHVEGADGRMRATHARPGTAAEAEELPPAPGMIRILSPFDPALRDRKRAMRLFGFDYRIEIFVPKARRKYGYYVFPVLEGERLIGRIDMVADRPSSALNVTGWWPERGVKLGAGRTDRLEAALARTARLAGCDTVSFAPGWRREP